MKSIVSSTSRSGRYSPGSPSGSVALRYGEKKLGGPPYAAPPIMMSSPWQSGECYGATFPRGPALGAMCHLPRNAFA